MKGPRRVFKSGIHYTASFRAVVESALGFSRDVETAVYLAALHLYLWRVPVKGKTPSSVHLTPRLDVVPVRRHHSGVGSSTREQRSWH
ncbi:MAG: hypothetical protein ACYTBS_14955 [Planctomycetota bacterium]|jgi:hypothetical protein